MNRIIDFLVSVVTGALSIVAAIFVCLFLLIIYGFPYFVLLAALVIILEYYK